MSRSRLQSLISNIDHMTCSLSSKNSPRNTVDFEAACSVYIRFRGVNGYLDRGRPVVTASRSRLLQVAGDNRDYGLVCKRNQLILNPGELEMADDGRAEGGPPYRCNYVDSSSPRPRPSACLGRGSSRGCHPCPYFGRSRVLEMTESGIREGFATLLGAWPAQSFPTSTSTGWISLSRRC